MAEALHGVFSVPLSAHFTLDIWLKHFFLLFLADPAILFASLSFCLGIPSQSQTPGQCPVYHCLAAAVCIF